MRSCQSHGLLEILRFLNAKYLVPKLFIDQSNKINKLINEFVSLGGEGTEQNLAQLCAPLPDYISDVEAEPLGLL